LCGYVSAAAGLAIGVPGVYYLFENAGQEWTLAENATSHAEYIKLKEENKIPISERE